MSFNTFDNLPKNKQDRVMDAAAQEFAAHGFHQASMNRLVKSLGIAKGSLFKYFGTKEGLFESLFQHSLHQIKASIRTAAKEQGNFFERIRSVMLAGLAFIDAHPRLYRIYLKLLFQEDTPLRGKLIATVRTSITNFLRPLVEEGIRCGELREDLDVETSVFILESILERFLQGARIEGIDDSLQGISGSKAEQRIDQILNLLTTGLASKQTHEE